MNSFRTEGSETYTVNPDQTARIPQIPEPASTALTLLAPVPIWLTRHGRARMLLPNTKHAGFPLAHASAV